jgi:hypothetical protein
MSNLQKLLEIQMPRPRHTDKPQEVKIYLPKSIHEKMMNQLYSDIEGRVPYGAVTTLHTELVVKWLESRGVEV